MTDWRQVIEAHGPAVWRTAYRLLGRLEDARDCYQEAFLSAVRLAAQEPVRDWAALLKRLAVARGLDMLRRRRRAADRAGDVEDCPALIADEAGPVARAQDAEFVERLRGVLATLPARQAQAVWLRYVEDCSNGEVGVALGIKENAAGVLLDRARKRLRKLMDGWMSESARRGEP